MFCTYWLVFEDICKLDNIQFKLYSIPTFGTKKSYSIRQLTTYLTSVDQDCQITLQNDFCNTVNNRKFIGKHGERFVILLCFCNNLWLISSLFNNFFSLTALLVQSCTPRRLITSDFLKSRRMKSDHSILVNW